MYTDHVGDFTFRHPDQVGTGLEIRLVFSMEGKPRGCCMRNRIMIGIYADMRIIRNQATVHFGLMKDEVAAPGRSVKRRVE